MPAAAAAPPSAPYLLLLGVAQDAGVPQSGCTCANCSAAWAGTAPRQTAVSAALVDPAPDESGGGVWIIDPTPDFREQYHALQQHLAAAGLAGRRLRGVLITHLHHGHYLGLAQFGKEVMDWRPGLPVHGTAPTLAFLAANQPWASMIAAGNLAPQPPLVPGGAPAALSPRLRVAAAAVPHRAEYGDTVCFYVEGPSRRALYLPDIDGWDAWAAAGTELCEAVSGVDVALLDGCFFSAEELPGRDMRAVPHPLVIDTLARLAGLPAESAASSSARHLRVLPAMAAPAAFESGHVDMVHDAQLDYYGKRLATCSSDRTVKVFDLAGDQRSLLADLRGHEGPVWQVAWAHPRYGCLLASASFDHAVILWKEGPDGQWGQVYKTPPSLHAASINSIAFAPHELGLILAAASSDGSVSIIEHKPDGSWESSKISNAHAIGVTAVSWAPAVPAGGLVSSQPPAAPAKRLCTAGCDNTVKVWKFSEAGWVLEATLAGHSDWVRDAAWAPNLGLPLNTIASAGQDGQVIAWTEGADGSWSRRLVHDFGTPAWRVSWSVAGNILAVSDANNAVSLWKEALDGAWQQIVAARLRAAMSEPSAAPAPAQPLSVADALPLMQAAVRRGELQEAAAVGARAVVPLSVRLEDLSLLGELASGAEATVLAGQLGGADVAVKRFTLRHSDDLLRFRRELSILASLAGHPRVVPLLGARALPPDYLIVMPLAPSSLHARLYALGWRPGAVELLALGVAAAEGLAAVHGAGYVHRDVKPSNLLVNGDGGLWLADFGLAAAADEVVAESTLSARMVRARGKPTGGFMRRAMAGTLEYMSPEVLLKRPASAASDVYALAVTLAEAWSGVYPFSDCTKDNPEVHTVLEHGYGRQELAAAVAAEGLRPSLPRGGPAGLAELLASAWQRDPAARPSAAALRDRLAGLLQDALADAAVHAPRPALAPPAAALHAAAGKQLAAGPGDGAGSGGGLVVVDCCRGGSGVAGGSSAPPSCGGSDVFDEDSETLASSTLSLLAPGRARPGGASCGSSVRSFAACGGGRGARASHSSASSLTSGEPWLLGGAEAGAGRPLSDEAASAAAAAAAAAAVPAAASLQGVLSLTAAASGGPRGVEAGGFGALGPREAMEDRHTIVQGLGGDPAITLACVFDGHRGAEAAAYAAAALPRALLLASARAGAAGGGAAAPGPAPSADGGSSVAGALRAAFLDTDAAFWQEWQAEALSHGGAGGAGAERWPGATALAAVVAGGALFVANAGDGRAVLARGGVALPLSRQHTADLPDERARVAAAGGAVALRGGSWRVGAAALQVTRALGDFDLKAPPAAQQHAAPSAAAAQQQHHQQHAGGGAARPRRSPYACGAPPLGMPVTAEPEVVSVSLTGADQFVVLGSDGLWDVISDAEAVGLVRDTVKDAGLAAKRLVQEALARGSADNVTAVVLFLAPAASLEAVWVRRGGGSVPSATPTFYGSRRPTTSAAAAAAGLAPPPASAAPDELMDSY
ncbi:SEC13B [Scenedesmus sp. PABB004]|nr:SEC13B [Scenedesmus sp. PABB004]